MTEKYLENKRTVLAKIQNSFIYEPFITKDVNIKKAIIEYTTIDLEKILNTFGKNFAEKDRDIIEELKLINIITKLKNFKKYDLLNSTEDDCQIMYKYYVVLNVTMFGNYVESYFNIFDKLSIYHNFILNDNKHVFRDKPYIALYDTETFKFFSKVFFNWMEFKKKSENFLSNVKKMEKQFTDKKNIFLKINLPIEYDLLNLLDKKYCCSKHYYHDVFIVKKNVNYPVDELYDKLAIKLNKNFHFDVAYYLKKINDEDYFYGDTGVLILVHMALTNKTVTDEYNIKIDGCNTIQHITNIKKCEGHFIQNKHINNTLKTINKYICNELITNIQLYIKKMNLSEKTINVILKKIEFILSINYNNIGDINCFFISNNNVPKIDKNNEKWLTISKLYTKILQCNNIDNIKQFYKLFIELSPYGNNSHYIADMYMYHISKVYDITFEY